MRLAITIGVLCLAFSPQLLAGGYRFSTIDYPDSELTELHGINAKGAIVGVYDDSAGVGHAFVLRNGVFKTLKLPKSFNSELAIARGINARGDIVGMFLDGSDGWTQGFLLSDGRFRRIEHPDALTTLVEEINNAGDITGSAFDEDSRIPFIRKGGKFHTVKFPPGTTDGAINAAQDNGRVLVGWISGADFGTSAYIRHKNGEFELVGHPTDPAINCYGFRYINQGGDIVGHFAVIGPDEECHPPWRESHGFVLRDGEFTLIDYPGIAITEPMGINDDGVIIGRYEDANGRVHGFKAVPRQH